MPAPLATKIVPLNTGRPYIIMSGLLNNGLSSTAVRFDSILIGFFFNIQGQVTTHYITPMKTLETITGDSFRYRANGSIVV